MANTVPCRWCGRPIIWVNSGNGRIPVENELTPYKRPKKGGVNLLYTSEGGRISCEILPDSREREAEGFAHRYHFCARRPVNYKAPSERETAREKYKSWREEKAAGEE